jgi:hypothetical protein
MAAKPPLRHEEVQRILRLLQPLSADRRIVLVGGQAVAFWTRFLEASCPELGLSQPLASKDIDFEGSAQSVRRAATLLAGTMKIASMDDNTPNTGIVLFTDADGIRREIDFIEAPLGLTARDVRDTAVQLVVPGDHGTPEVPIWVMHPERCMESRIVNATDLGKTSPLAMRQLEASIVCARAWSRFVLDNRQLPLERRVRAVLKLNERVFRKCVGDRRFRAVALDHNVHPFEAVLVDDERLPEDVRAQRYPQMREQLDERLKRDRSNRARAARARAARAAAAKRP